MKSKFVPLWLFFVFSAFVLPWWNRVYLLWDDLVFLIQFHFPTWNDFLIPHGYQFHPLFNSYFWLMTHAFGVSPNSFLVVATVLHLFNICFVYLIIRFLTKSTPLAGVSLVLSSFNKSFFTVQFWPSLHSTLIVTIFLFFAGFAYYRLTQKFSQKMLILFGLTVLLASYSQGFALGAGLIFFVATLIFWRKAQRGYFPTLLVSFGTGCLSILAAIIFSIPDVERDNVFAFSAKQLFNIVYFTGVGVGQAIISRFFIPGFTPNIYNLWNVVIMILLPSIVVLFILAVVFQTLLKGKKFDLLPLFFFSAYTILPYFIASLARSNTGGLGGLAERYVYVPFISFILMLTYSVYLAISYRIVPRNALFAVLGIGITTLLSMGHLIAMQIYVMHFFI